jgi:hypothetical protein
MQSNSTERSQLRDAALPPPLVAATPKFVPVAYRTPSLPDTHVVATPSHDAPSPSSSLEYDSRAISRKEEFDGDHLANSDRLNDYRIVGVIFAGTPVRVILAQHDSREPDKMVHQLYPGMLISASALFLFGINFIDHSNFSFPTFLRFYSTQVAIKCFDRALISHPERIDREIAASRAACHPHIVRFIEAFATPREVCIAMGTLHEIILVVQSDWSIWL